MNKAQLELVKRYEGHPIGLIIEHIKSAPNAEAMHCYQVMVLAMAELLAWQDQIDIKERDALQQLAFDLVKTEGRLGKPQTFH